MRELPQMNDVYRLQSALHYACLAITKNDPAKALRLARQFYRVAVEELADSVDPDNLVEFPLLTALVSAD